MSQPRRERDDGRTDKSKGGWGILRIKGQMRRVASRWTDASFYRLQSGRFIHAFTTLFLLSIDDSITERGKEAGISLVVLVPAVFECRPILLVKLVKDLILRQIGLLPGVTTDNVAASY